SIRFNMKKIVILGSTGSIGTSALQVISRHKDKFEVIGLSANRNAELLARQAARFHPRILAIGEGEKYKELKKALKRPQRVLSGIEGVSEIASLKDADVVLMAISGADAIRPLLSAISAGKTIALANKESVVSAGKIVMSMARTHRANIIPVDSEHNSILQCINKENMDNIARVFLMGTGGPLKDVSKSVFDRLKPSRILAHPVWRMGKKISVDSATMMNKGLEVIEASYLFDIHASRIEVLIHPEAVIHSMVELRDGNVMANLFSPDMRIPIFYALSYPERPLSYLPRLNFHKIGRISFEKPDRKKFKSLDLCYRAAKAGGTNPACLNSANEEAVRLYLEGKVHFTGIPDLVEKTLAKHKNVSKPSLDDIFHVIGWAREEVRRLCVG
ncbi:MAG: 1-deoxy-D-xylulose-5-phosphate reductoisomerase, partial [Candidatus Omnitrophica bacterium]|nr:1-deoxy-D-xylulose-5-phosphate reductoisomerase [Candidatus Omnitrophota bacterium]